MIIVRVSFRVRFSATWIEKYIAELCPPLANNGETIVPFPCLIARCVHLCTGSRALLDSALPITKQHYLWNLKACFWRQCVVHLSDLTTLPHAGSPRYLNFTFSRGIMRHWDGPGCAKARTPHDDNVARGTSSCPRFTERRFWRPGSLDTGWHIVDK